MCRARAPATTLTATALGSMPVLTASAPMSAWQQPMKGEHVAAAMAAVESGRKPGLGAQLDQQNVNEGWRDGSALPPVVLCATGMHCHRLQGCVAWISTRHRRPAQQLQCTAHTHTAPMHALTPSHIAAPIDTLSCSTPVCNWPIPIELRCACRRTGKQVDRSLVRRLTSEN